MRRFVGFLALVALGVAASACGGTSRLHEYAFAERRVAVVAAIPPRPLVFTDGFFDARLDPRDPVGTAFRVGSAFAKHNEARKAQARMDSALAAVDVAERVARQTLVQGARHLGYRPVDHPREADFVIDVRVFDYGLVASSWEAATYFEIDAEVLMVEAATRRVIWRERVREHEPVSAAFFGLGRTLGNVYTAATLSALSTEEMAQALEHLADYTADRLTAELRRDYYRGGRRADRSLDGPRGF